MKTLIKIILSLLATVGVVFIGIVAFIVFNVKHVDNQYNGQDLFNAVNAHRKSIGVQEVQLDSRLCDNLVERWAAVREPGNLHKGFDEWAVGEGLVKDGAVVAPYSPRTGLSEIFILNATTVDWAIQGWLGSPGHKLALENPNVNVGCAYANQGTGIVLMAETSK